MRRARGAAAAVVVGAAMLLGGGVARAMTATCDVPIIQALPGSGDTKLDPKIGLLRPYLSKPPFTGWHDFKLLDRKMLTIAEGASQQFMMPGGRAATLTFVEHIAGSGHHRMRLRLWIDHPQNKHRAVDTTFVLDEGGVVLHVGQHHDNGILVVGVSCKTQD